MEEPSVHTHEHRRNRLPRGPPGAGELHGRRSYARTRRANRTTSQELPPLQSGLRRRAECCYVTRRPDRFRSAARVQPALIPEARRSLGPPVAKATLTSTGITLHTLTIARLPAWCFVTSRQHRNQIARLL